MFALKTYPSRSRDKNVIFYESPFLCLKRVDNKAKSLYRHYKIRPHELVDSSLKVSRCLFMYIEKSFTRFRGKLELQ